jgi:hypothetical protein
MTPKEQEMYDRICRLQGSCSKLIDHLQLLKGMISGHHGEWYCSHCQSYFRVKRPEMARCICCGESLLVKIPDIKCGDVGGDT